MLLLGGQTLDLKSLVKILLLELEYNTYIKERKPVYCSLGTLKY